HAVGSQQLADLRSSWLRDEICLMQYPSAEHLSATYRPPTSGSDRVSRASPIQTAMRTRDGQVYEGPPLSYGFDAPLAYYRVPKRLRWYRCLLTTDTCRIDERLFFIVGNIRIPIRGKDNSFSWPRKLAEIAARPIAFAAPGA